ncbi:MAG: amino acid racemase [Bacteroidales bacterium]|nr:amino acid racemase [Bacteroidales bacterium]
MYFFKSKLRIDRIVPVLIPFLILFSVQSSCSLLEQDKENNAQPEKILGIFGGMGPEATAELYRQIVKLTPAQKDQDHIPTLIYSMPQVPDRMASIRYQDLSIVPYLVEGVTRLENAGASFIAIPCNTVHYFFGYMQDAVSIPIIHMIRETVNEVAEKYPDIKDIGLLATTGTIETKLYENEFAEEGFRVILPDEEIENEKVMKAVFGIKAGTSKKVNEDLLAEAGQNLVEKGAKLIVLGCTEIPLAFNSARVEVPVVNATEVLAKKAIQLYTELAKENN